MINRNIKALPIKNHGDTDAIFIDDVAAIMERGTVTHVILASVQAAADGEFPTALYRRVMVRLIIPTDRRYEIGKEIATGRVSATGRASAARALRICASQFLSGVYRTRREADRQQNLAVLCHRD